MGQLVVGQDVSVAVVNIAAGAGDGTLLLDLELKLRLLVRPLDDLQLENPVDRNR